MTATYAYCLVASSRRPAVPRGLRGLPHAGRVRLLDVEPGLWIVVSDVPLSHYGEAALALALADLDRVSRMAVAHEAVVEAFLAADAVLPMKLFTIFATDERAREHVLASRNQIVPLVERVALKEEWGVRVLLARATSTRAAGVRTAAAPSGSGYLRQKKAQRDAHVDRARNARSVATEIYDELAALASEARKRPSGELPAAGAALLLDAAFLVPRRAAKRLKAAATRKARALHRQGYDVALTGPWPPYSFMQE
jgi:hypothetical protein